MNYLTLDIETYHPERLEEIHTEKLRVSVVGAYLSWLDEYVAFLEADVKDFLALLRQVDLVVGYNHIWFDLPVLQKYADFKLKNLPCYDIMLEIEKKIGYKLKLDEVCRVNLGVSKTDFYARYKDYYWDQNWFPLIDYCMHDVRFTNQIFQRILDTGKIQYPDMHQIKEIELEPPQAGKNQVLIEDRQSIF